MKDGDDAEPVLYSLGSRKILLTSVPISNAASIVRPACGWHIKRKWLNRELL